MKTNWRWISILTLSGLFLSLPSANVFARECNRHCLEQLLGQIATLREEVRNSIPIGTILPYSGAQALPVGYLICDGAALDRADYADLFAVVGLSYTPAGALAGNTFHLPDLRGRAPIGTRDQAAGVAGIALGEMLGQETQQLGVANLPPHQHDGTTLGNNVGHHHPGIAVPGGVHRHPHLAFDTPTASVQTIPSSPFGFLGSAASAYVSRNLLASVLHGDGPSDGYGPTGEHQHDLAIGPESNTHGHYFLTNNGAAQGLQGTAFSVMSPSIGVRYMIKAR